MGDIGSAWKDTGERFAALGASLKAHYDTERDTDAAMAKRDLGEAARRFAGAVQEAVDALGAAAKDPAVQEDVRRVGTSLAEALAASFAEVTSDLRRMADATPGGDAQPEHSGTPATGPDMSPSTPPEPGAEAASRPSEGDETPPKVEPWGTP